jgi:hypothetical protein
MKVIPRHGVRLGTQADVMMAAQRIRRLFHRLSKRRAAVPARWKTGSNIKVSVEIDNRRRLSAGRVPEVMAERRFVAATDDDRDPAGRPHHGHDLREGLLRRFQSTSDQDVAQVDGRRAAKFDPRPRVPRCQPEERVANGLGSLGGTDTPVV